MDSVREIAEAGKPVLTSMCRDGSIIVVIGSKAYEYWIDSAIHKWLRAKMLKDPWATLNWIKKNCRGWRKI